jgi:cyclophilin family peptidyl-prolyl cis-trans isomerase
MASRLGIAVAISMGLASWATAQVVRFETSIGEFDMVLNPTNNARLQGHVDNMLLYVENGAYNNSWINRADEGFVLQMGGFYSHTVRPPKTIESTRPVNDFAPVQGEPMITGLSNTRGTVSLALPGGAGGTNQDGGTSSFFVNLGSNTGLDADFTVFGAISNMAVIDQIMALTQIDRTTEPDFGAGTGNLAFSDVPLQANGFQVFIKRAFVIDDAMTVEQAAANVASTMALSAEAAGAALAATSAPLQSAGGAGQLSSASVPEPATAALILLGVSALAGSRLARRP